MPPGSYQLGCGLKNMTRAAYAWSDYRVELRSAERRRTPREPNRKRRSIEHQDA
jgi:hypothetical protein